MCLGGDALERRLTDDAELVLQVGTLNLRAAVDGGHHCVAEET